MLSIGHPQLHPDIYVEALAHVIRIVVETRVCWGLRASALTLGTSLRNDSRLGTGLLH